MNELLVYYGVVVKVMRQKIEYNNVFEYRGGVLCCFVVVYIIRFGLFVIGLVILQIEMVLLCVIIVYLSFKFFCC